MSKKNFYSNRFICIKRYKNHYINIARVDRDGATDHDSARLFSRYNINSYFINQVENERKQLLNGLSDAIKECQLRFGGKRELATDLDSRVCVLCLKLEAIFMHGLKKKPMLISNSSLSSQSILTSTLQLNSIINLKQKTGNLISQFFDETTTNLKPNLVQSNSQINQYDIDISFWSFIKNLMNKFDVERYEMLTNIKTNTGRHRAWLRSCLNEHCLERFTIAVLANESLTSQYYEEWAFLLDKAYNSTLPMLISGLESILFAIHIDNPNLNIPTKLANSSSTSPVGMQQNSDLENRTNELGASTSFSDSTVKINKKALSNINSKKIRKNNVVVLDNDESKELKKSPSSTSLRSKSAFSPNRILVNPINYISLKSNDSDITATTNSMEKKISESSDVFEPDSDIITTKTNTNTTTNANLSKSVSSNSLKYTTRDTNKKEADLNDISTDSSADTDIYTKIDTNANLIPVTPSFPTGPVDSISINSYQSENSNEINFNSNKATNAPNGSYNAQSFKISPSSLTSGNSIDLINSINRTSTLIANEYDGLSLKEMREFVLTMIQRKDDLESKYKKLDESHKQELSNSKELNEKLNQLEHDYKLKNDNLEHKLQNLESENKLLKDQLKKYVSAVQMIRSNTINNTNNSADLVSLSSNSNSVPTNAATASAIPALNPNLQRDYSYEAEQYEKKLIQVAEMHGELMEFNSRLHKLLNFKTIQIEKLKQELTELRGPLPNELTSDNADETLSMLSDIENISSLNGALIHIWIPSAFLRTNKSDSHHVYQIYIRIRDEEWNIYRRFSHFYNLNSKLKEKYPQLSGIKFPKKKAIGNKDAKFVENRRKLLQDYLRQVVNKVLQLDRDLNLKPCRETLSKSIPFLSDQHFFCTINDRSNTLFNGQSFTNPTFGNSLGHIVRNNTFLEANDLLHQQTNSPVMNRNTSLLINNPMNEPLYTGL